MAAEASVEFLQVPGVFDRFSDQLANLPRELSPTESDPPEPIMLPNRRVPPRHDPQHQIHLLAAEGFLDTAGVLQGHQGDSPHVTVIALAQPDLLTRRRE